MTDKPTYKERVDVIKDAPVSDSGYTPHDNAKSLRFENISTADDTVNITEPSSPNHPSHLYNKVEKSLSGHVKEIDDTPGAERIMEMHKSGTFYEIHPDGTRVLRVYGDNFEIALSDNNLLVGGNLNITVQGDANILTKGNVKHKIGGDFETVVHGNMSTRVEGTRIDYTKGDHDVQTASNLRTRSTADTSMHAQGNMNLQTNANMIQDSGGTTTCFSAGAYKTSTNSTLQMKSASTMNVQAGAVLYLDGTQIQENLPGPSVSITDPETNDPTDKDPTGGLIIADSVAEPTADTFKILKTGNEELVTLVDTDVTYPKDRTPLT